MTQAVIVDAVRRLGQTGGRFGLQVRCEAGGLANPTIIDRI